MEAGFELVTRAPDPRLRGFVRAFHDFRERAPGPLERREIASPHAVVIVDLGPGWEVDGVRHGSFTGGLYAGPVTVGHDGEARAVQIDVTPLGARALLGVPLGALTEQVVALEDLLGPDARRLAERLAEAGSSDERFAALDGALLDRLDPAARPRPDVLRAWRRLVETAGSVRVEDLARELRCSRRHLSGRFAEEVGLPPKAYARVLRFQRAVDALLGEDGGGERGLAEVAAACGFADQSHLNREFRALAGATPTKLLAERRAMSG
jgi:AraC-like DNA-binding protein